VTNVNVERSSNRRVIEFYVALAAPLMLQSCWSLAEGQMQCPVCGSRGFSGAEELQQHVNAHFENDDSVTQEAAAGRNEATAMCSFPGCGALVCLSELNAHEAAHR
jgi:hypothetical protein